PGGILGELFRPGFPQPTVPRTVQAAGDGRIRESGVPQGRSAGAPGDRPEHPAVACGKGKSPMAHPPAAGADRAWSAEQPAAGSGQSADASGDGLLSPRHALPGPGPGTSEAGAGAAAAPGS